jgi:hypothetical protein
MALALLVEDGTGVAGANSFATLAQARDYAALRGVNLSAVDSVVTAFLVKATDWLKPKSYLGTKTNAGETYLPWPRSDIVVDDEDFDEDTVPTGIVEVTCQLCIEQHNGVTLSPSAKGAGIKREKIGPMDTEYATSSRATTPRMPIVEDMLNPWLASRGGLRTLRV